MISQLIMNSMSGSLRLGRLGEGVLVLGLVLLEEALLGGLLLLFWGWLAGVELPAGADGDHEDCDEEQHEHVRELVGRDYAEVVLLTFEDLLFGLFLELLAL